MVIQREKMRDGWKSEESTRGRKSISRKGAKWNKVETGRRGRHAIITKKVIER